MWEGIRQIKRYFERPPEKSIYEQQKEVIDAAEEWDRLTAFPAWTKALRFLATDVNGTLIEATKRKENPQLMAVYVTRWDAKRELLDSLQAEIETTMRERDRIVAEYKEMQDEQQSNARN